MTEKIGFVKNPLTVVAIFAGIAEVSSVIVLPQLQQSQQSIFIWFVMSFPLVLVTLFFLTLNFNSRVLYAPSDFSDEENYMRTLEDRSKTAMELANIGESGTAQ